ncbi:MAG: cytochrome c3 family protein [Bradymonadaceae bacterium]
MRRRPPQRSGEPRWWPEDRTLFGLSVLLAAVAVAAVPGAGESETPADPLDETVMSSEGGDGGIVPDRPDAIEFSHEKHADVECAHCHGAGDGAETNDGGDAVAPSKAANDADEEVELRRPRRSNKSIKMPGMAVCADCHGGGNGDETDVPAPKLANCSGCHAGYEGSAEGPIEEPKDWRAVRPAPMIPPRPKADVQFDHAAHVQRLTGDDAAGATCHGDGDEPSMPTLETCRSCHGDDEEAGTLKPSNHTVAWERRHGTVARSMSGRCEDCHTENDCANCHTDTASEPFSVHPPNFDTLHAVDARAQSEECAECHTIQTFCRQCHARTNFSPTAPDRPPPRFDAHPPNWTTPNAPGNHAELARRNIADCASCHTENDCVQCHQGVDPHPPEFQLKCGQWLEANPTPCAKCHGDLGELQAKCL